MLKAQRFHLDLETLQWKKMPRLKVKAAMAKERIAAKEPPLMASKILLFSSHRFNKFLDSCPIFARIFIFRPRELGVSL